MATLPPATGPVAPPTPSPAAANNAGRSLGLGLGLRTAARRGVVAGVKLAELLPGDVLNDADQQYAVSFGKIVSSYNGPIIRGRRLSDNSEQDFNAIRRYGRFMFVDPDEIVDFGQGGGVRIVQQYNQASGRPHNWNAENASLQPEIVRTDGTPVLTTSGRPAMTSLDVAGYLGVPNVSDAVARVGHMAYCAVWQGDPNGQALPFDGEHRVLGCRESQQLPGLFYDADDGGRLGWKSSFQAELKLSDYPRLQSDFYKPNRALMCTNAPGSDGILLEWNGPSTRATGPVASEWIRTGKRPAWLSIESFYAPKSFDGIQCEAIFILDADTKSLNDLRLISAIQGMMWGTPS